MLSSGICMSNSLMISFLQKLIEDCIIGILLRYDKKHSDIGICLQSFPIVWGK